MWPPTGLIPWFSKTKGNTYTTLLHHPFLFKGKPTQCSRGSKKDFWRGCRGDSRQVKSRFDSQQRAISGAVAGESTHKSRHTKYPSQTLIPRITLFSICLSFSSPPLHKNIFPFISHIFCLPFSRSIFCLLVLPCVFYLLASLPTKYRLIWIPIHYLIFLKDPIMMNQLVVSLVH